MPDLRNLSVNDAKNKLKDAGFRGEVQFTTTGVSDPSLDSVVISQSVAPNQGVDAEGTIQVGVGRFSGSSSSSNSSSNNSSNNGGRGRGN
jgi:beta-lactam-binding protein with PASTA domain